jgi:hypothetical protein
MKIRPSRFWMPLKRISIGVKRLSSGQREERGVESEKLH